MLSFGELLSERYTNIIGDNELKELYKQDVWDILQLSYKQVGGIKGSGFSSPDDMVKNIPFWKIAVKGKTPVAVVLYKDNGSRKFVTLGTNGTEVGKRSIVDMMKNELERSYGEVSKAALAVMMKSIPYGDLPEDAKRTLDTYPQLRKYGYLRDIGGKIFFKVLLGTPNLRIR